MLQKIIFQVDFGLLFGSTCSCQLKSAAACLTTFVSVRLFQKWCSIYCLAEMQKILCTSLQCGNRLYEIGRVRRSNMQQNFIQKRQCLNI
jgi:thiaminase